MIKKCAIKGSPEKIIQYKLINIVNAFVKILIFVYYRQIVVNAVVTLQSDTWVRVNIYIFSLQQLFLIHVFV